MHTARATHLRRHSNSSSDDSHAGIAPATDGMVTLRAVDSPVPERTGDTLPTACALQALLGPYEALLLSH